MSAADLRPTHPPRQLYFLAKALECVRGRRYAVTDCLESDCPQLQIFRFINLAHPTFADRANDAETPKDKLSWPEPGTSVAQEPVEMSDRCVKRPGIFLFGLEKLFEMHL